MGKRKRSKSRDSRRLRKENKKLKEELRKRQRLDSSASDSSASETQDSHTRRESLPVPTELADMSMDLSPMRPDEGPETEILNGTIDQNENSKEAEEDLDPVILEILGDDPSNENQYGENLHKQILPRWQHILAKGLDKEVKSELCKLYLPPENCGNIRAPKLNPQVLRFLSDVNKKKEMFNENKQNQLSSCLSALGKVLNTLLSCKDKAVPQDIIKPLSDAGRLLCDFHYRESQSRRFAIINVINKDLRDTLKNTKIDEYLFGADLADQLKLEKEISKVAMDLRNPRSSTAYRPPAAAQVQRGALNFRGARGAASTPRQYPSQRQPAASARGATSSRGRDQHRRYDSSSSRRNVGRNQTRRY